MIIENNFGKLTGNKFVVMSLQTKFFEVLVGNAEEELVIQLNWIF